MNHIIRYDGYTPQQRVDDILDKICKYGIDSITIDELDFLNSYRNGEEELFHNKMKVKEYERIFEDFSGNFKFEHTDTEDYGDEMHYIGIIYVPDLKFPSGKVINGRLVGRIISYNNNQTGLDFYSESKNGYSYDIFEFCNGLEYELDVFIDYVVSEIREKSNN
jgi:hypothetical protein